MTPSPSLTAPLSSVTLTPAIEEALRRIAPLWPLRHWVAVNPFLGLVDRPFSEACALLERTAGAAPLQSPADYLALWRHGVIQLRDLETVCGDEGAVQSLVATLARATQTTNATGLCTFAEWLDRRDPRARWERLVVEEISKVCAGVFDENQTTWTSPWKSDGLYAGWREGAKLDANPEAFGLTGFRAFVRDLPENADACLEWALQRLLPVQVPAVDFLHRQLLSVAGWAGHVQYRVREDAMRGRVNPTLRELLAIRLAYDAALLHAFGQDGVVRSEWRQQAAPTSDAESLQARVQWQRAYEWAYQRTLAQSLAGPAPGPRSTRPSFQAVFCIDVRSEVYRRHLEAIDSDAQTLGFAGFFGFALAHHGPDSPAPSPRSPALLVPSLESGEPGIEVHQNRRTETAAWRAFQHSAISCFSFVEAVGAAFAGVLGRSARPRPPVCSRATPAFLHDRAVPLATRISLAEGTLTGLSLREGFARIVLLCGHGSQSSNNPFASSLDCGACGGHAGDVNARIAAATLNQPEVRAGLAQRGIRIPDDTVFLAGLHDTTTDEVTVFADGAVPGTHSADLSHLRSALARASAAVRRERAPALGLAALHGEALLNALRARALDPAELRPEWGLAKNAALIIAPRSRTARINLHGRAFLHDYQAEQDPHNRVLTQILCAPTVVASWINLQYYASRVDPARYASGNKMIHQVVGGIGVIEGNGGDLKVGLPLQSIHNGDHFVHEPRRLSVYVEAPPERILAVLNEQPGVRQLFDHGWIHLFAIAGGQVLHYQNQAWQPVETTDSSLAEESGEAALQPYFSTSSW